MTSSTHSPKNNDKIGDEPSEFRVAQARFWLWIQLTREAFDAKKFLQVCGAISLSVVALTVSKFFFSRYAAPHVARLAWKRISSVSLIPIMVHVFRRTKRFQMLGLALALLQFNKHIFVRVLRLGNSNNNGDDDIRSNERRVTIDVAEEKQHSNPNISLGYLASHIAWLRSIASSRAALAREFVAQKKLVFHDVLQRQVQQQVDKALDKLQGRLKLSVKDRDMPKFVRRGIDETVDMMMPDIRYEVQRKTGEYVTYFSPLSPLRNLPRSSTGKVLEMNLQRRKEAQTARRFLLKHSLRKQMQTRLKAGAAETPIRSFLTGSRGMPRLKSITPVPFTSNEKPGKPENISFSSRLQTILITTPKIVLRSTQRIVSSVFKKNKEEDTAPLGEKEMSKIRVNFDLDRHKPIVFWWDLWNENECDVQYSGMRLHLARSRAYILYTLSPYDKSMWRCFKDPMWWLLSFIGVVPVVGPFWWFILFFLKDMSDEHQVCDFIVGFQTIRFCGQGVSAALMGCFRYYLCANRQQNNCDEYGPSSSNIDMILFCTQLLFVWRAFSLLHFTSRMPRFSDYSHNLNKIIRPVSPTSPSGRNRNRSNKSKNRRVTRRYNGGKNVEKKSETVEIENQAKSKFHFVTSLFFRNKSLSDFKKTIVKGERRKAKRGGRLPQMLFYDTIIVVLSLLLVIITYIAGHTFDIVEWQLNATLYWIKVFYGLLCFPFVFFKLPVLERFLLHTSKTGYDELGYTLPVVKNLFMEEEEVEEQEIEEKNQKKEGETLKNENTETEKTFLSPHQVNECITPPIKLRKVPKARRRIFEDFETKENKKEILKKRKKKKKEEGRISFVGKKTQNATIRNVSVLELKKLAKKYD
eukprot:g3258.t1